MAAEAGVINNKAGYLQPCRSASGEETQTASISSLNKDLQSQRWLVSGSAGLGSLTADTERTC